MKNKRTRFTFIFLVLAFLYSPGRVLALPLFPEILDVQKINKSAELKLRLFGQGSKKVKVIFFWASWCQYCKQLSQEIYKITSFNENIFEFVGISVDVNKSEGQKLANTVFRNIKKMFWVPSKVQQALGLSRLPSILIVAKSGEIDTIYEGSESDKISYLKKRLKNLEPKSGSGLDEI